MPVELRRLDSARNMRRFYRLDVQPDLFGGVEPENEAQAALAVHVACLHTASLNVLSRTPSIGERNIIAMATAWRKT